MQRPWTPQMPLTKKRSTEQRLEKGQEAQAARGERLVPLSDASVRESVQNFLRNQPDQGGVIPEMGLPTGAPDEVTAEVTLTGRARIPLLGLVVRRWRVECL